MGINKLKWVRMGALGHRGRKQHKNKPSRGYGRCFRPGFGCYDRGNFPGHHVLGCLTKRGVDGYCWVQSGLDGCTRTHTQGQKQKLGKKCPKWVRRGRFVKHARSEKNKEGGNDGYRVRGGAFRRIWV